MHPSLKLYLLIALFIITGKSYGQLNFKDGYIISPEDDTLYGKINDGGKKDNYSVCRFREARGTKTTVYVPGEIKAYRFTGGSSYVSGTVYPETGEKTIFLEVLLEGSVKLYYDRKGGYREFYIEDEEGAIHELTIREEYLYRQNPIGYNASQYDQVRLNYYKDTLEYVFRDSEKALRQLRRTEYEKRSLVDVTRKYIGETCTGENCILYEADLRTGIRTSVFTAVQFNRVAVLSEDFTLSDFENINDTPILGYFSFPLGISVDFPLKVFQDRLSFRFTAAGEKFRYNEIFSNPPEEDYTVNINATQLYFPLSLKYDFGHGRLASYISCGTLAGFGFDNRESRNEVSMIMGGWTVETGLEFRTNTRLSFYGGLHYQSIWKFMTGTKTPVTGFTAGLDQEDYSISLRKHTIALVIGIRL